MDTRFEFNLKGFEIKGSDTAVWLQVDGKVVLKLAYKDIRSAAKFLLQQAQKYLADDSESTPIAIAQNSVDE